MADKFIRHGATFNGDGTSSALATVDGGVGAWNNINILEGTAPAYGVLAAGNTVFIRSKDEAGADIVRTLAATVTLGSSATSTLPISWVLDAGAVWSGINGVLTYNCPSTYVVGFAQNNKFRCDAEDAWSIVEANAAADKTYITSTNLELENLKFDMSAATTSYGVTLNFYGSGHAVAKNCAFKFGRTNVGYAAFLIGYEALLRLVNPRIELTLVAPANAVFHAQGYTRIEIIGGVLYGVGATTGKSLFAFNGSTAMNYSFVGFKYPQTMSWALTYYTTGIHSSAAEIMASDGAAGGASVTQAGWSESRRDGYYPTLDARLPDSVSTPWSWFLYPKSATGLLPQPTTCSKLFTAADAVKTLGFKFLVSDTFVGLNKRNVYAIFTYVDAATGLGKCVSTQDYLGASLLSSSAAWSATTYGAVNLLKRELSVTTPTAIKQDTIITATFVCEKASSSGNDTIILCPDFTVA